MSNGKAGPPLGNTNGSHDKPWQKALLIELKTYDPENPTELPKPTPGVESKVEDYYVLRRLARIAIDKGLAEDMGAINHIADRIDGKPMQATQLTGPDGGPMQFQEVVRTIVKPKDSNS